MKTSEKGKALIREFESLRLEAYRCPAGVLTIGYGHTAGVKEGDRIDKRCAEYFLDKDLEDVEAVINRECPGVNQNQFDALASFVFNLGVKKFLPSTLLKCVKANPGNPNIRGEFLRWVKAGGVTLSGLMRRRRREAELYFS